jgi:drug/metabolite transporter (DMT)-like permease
LFFYSEFVLFCFVSYLDRLPPVSIALLIIGSVVGTGIGYSSWWCRGLVSATSFTLIGVVNKCLTILLNVLIWDQHATPGGIFALAVCISGGMIYQQAPMRGETPHAPASEEKDVEGLEEETMGLIETHTTTQKRRNAV